MERTITLPWVLLALLAGCDGTAPSPGDWSLQDIPSLPPDGSRDGPPHGLADRPGPKDLPQDLSAHVSPPTRGEYIAIPGGSFLMGSPADEPGREDDEALHEVTIDLGYLIKATEVTQGEWESLFGNNPSWFRVCGPDCPVESVSFWDALAYVNALSEALSLEQCYDLVGCQRDPGWGLACSEASFRGLMCQGYRLPTEAEWELAALAMTNIPPLESLGCETDPHLDQVGWYCANSDYQPHPVASKGPNAWGLYDVQGGVSEWVWDWYDDYPVEAVISPMGPPLGDFRVHRGGSWNSHAQECRIAARDRSLAETVSSSRGFRPARTIL